MRKFFVIILLFSATLLFSQRISELPEATSAESGDIFAIVQSGVTKKLTYDAILTSIASDNPYIDSISYNDSRDSIFFHYTTGAVDTVIIPITISTWTRDSSNREVYLLHSSDNDVSAYKDSVDFIAQSSPEFTGSLTVWLKDFINANKFDLFDNTPINNASIVFIGDSEVEPFANGLKKLFDEKFDYSGHGYVTMREVNYSQTENHPWTMIGNSWTFDASHDDILGLHGQYAENTDNDGAILITSGHFNRLRFHYRQISGGGEFKWKVNHDGVLSAAISTDGATAAKITAEIDAEADYTPGDTLYIYCSSGTVRLYGVVMYKEYVSGKQTYPVEVHRIFRGGSTYPDWNKQNSAAWDILDSLSPSLIFVNFLENTMTIDETYYLMVDSLVKNLRSARDSIESDIVITSIQPSVGAYAQEQRLYNYRAAKNNDVGHYDFYQRSGDWAVLNGLGVLSTNHLKYEGAYMTGLRMFDLLIPDGYTEKANYYLEIPVTVNADTGTIKQDGLIIWQRYGTENNFFANAGNYTTTGSYNIGIGNLSLTANTTGNRCIGIGRNTLYRNTQGPDRIAIGNNSQLYGAICSYNVSLGSSSLMGVDGTTTAANSVAIGYEAGKLITTANYGTFIGYQAGGAGSPLSGESNTFIGYKTGFNNTSGRRNVFVGASAGLTNSTGQYNTIVGTFAGDGSNASSNSILGYMSGTSNSSGGSNTFLGAESGYTNTTGAFNVFTGYRAGYKETGGYRSYWAADSTSWSNGMSSGSKLLWYGDMSDASKSNHFMNIFGNLAINEAKNPSYALEVNGDINGLGSYRLDNYEIIGNSGTPLLLINSSSPYVNVNGNFSCGSLGRSPAAELEVNGTTITTILKLTPSSAPGSPSEGTIYMDSSTHKLMVYDGTSWQACW